MKIKIVTDAAGVEHEIAVPENPSDVAACAALSHPENAACPPDDRPSVAKKVLKKLKK